MAKHRVWVTGAAGLIGSQIVELAPRDASSHTVIGLHRGVVDLTCYDAVRTRFGHDRPTLLIHCAAVSQTPRCERDPELARRVNVDVTGFLVDLFRRGRVIFFSTDLVFNGRTGDYGEDDSPDPLGVYATTKVEAEHIVRSHANHLIIRTSLNGGVSPGGNRGFNEALRRAWSNGHTTRLFVDEYRCPIGASVTARATWELAQSELQGTFHVAGAERLSRFETGELIAARHPELRPRLEAVSLRDHSGPPRAADCSLNISKAQQHLSFRLPGLTEWLQSQPIKLF